MSGAAVREARPARKTGSRTVVSMTPARRVMLRGGILSCQFHEGQWTVGHISQTQNVSILGTFGDDFEAAARWAKLVARTLRADLQIIAEGRS